jgi:hypothetical protein
MLPSQHAASVALSVLDPGEAVVRILLPDDGGFLTVAWSKDDAGDGKVPLARDLMKKVLASYSKRLSGLSNMSTNFERRAALDFAKYRSSGNSTTTISSSISTLSTISTAASFDRSLLEVYRFAVVRGTKRTLFPTQQPLVTLFMEGGDGRKPMQMVTLGLWRSNWEKDKTAKKPRRR